MQRLAMTVLWPSFLVSIVAEGFLFSMVDPQEIILAHNLIDLSPHGIYTIGFFCIWLFCAMACALTYYLATVPGAEV